MILKKNKSKWYIILFLLILITISSYILPKELGDLDEIWIYNSAKNIADGLLPYKDFNLVTTPFLPLLAGGILKLLGSEVLVMRGLAILLGTSILFMMIIIMKKLKIHSCLIGIAIILELLLLKPYICIDYNFMISGILLGILLLEMKKMDARKQEIAKVFQYDLFIGILAGTAIGLKQTTGLILTIISLFSTILIVKTKQEWKEFGKVILVRVLGVAIPVGILAMYLSAFALWPYFIDYCILGVKEFTNSIPYTELWNNSNFLIKWLAIGLPFILLYWYFQTVVKKQEIENKQKLFCLFSYSVASCAVIFPISDDIHFLIGVLPAYIGMFYLGNQLLRKIAKRIKTEKIKGFLKEFLKCGIIIFLVLMMLENMRNLLDYFNQIKQQPSTLLHYSYIPISEGIQQRIKTVNHYIQNEEKEVYILDASAAIFKIPMDRYDKHYDLFLKGNLGRNGTEKLIEEIRRQENIQILIQKPPRNWQTPEEVITFVQNNYPKVGEIDWFDIYEK